jgi:hypothetical protein
MAVMAVNELLARLWRLGKPLQWRLLWFMHAKFICGVTGIVCAGDGRLLLLRHRLWPRGPAVGIPDRLRQQGRAARGPHRAGSTRGNRPDRQGRAAGQDSQRLQVPDPGLLRGHP